MNDSVTPYFIQAYQELGCTCYDFSYLREALGDRDLLSVSPSDDANIFWLCMFDGGNIELPQKELVASKIHEMLETTDDNFIIIYGSTDPYYSERIEDVLDKPNISIYVDKYNSHSSVIQTFDEETQQEIINKIKTFLNVK